MTYKFVTQEEINYAARDGWFTRGGLELCGRLLAERDAYREVALGYQKEFSGTRLEGIIDAEAARILGEK